MSLKPISSSPTKWDMSNVITFDIEAYEWTNPVALGMYDGQNYESFTSDTLISDFVDELLRRKYRNKRFVAHNGGNYDFGFILDELNKRDVNYQMLTKGNNSVFYVKIKDEYDKPRYLQDSFSLLPRSLEKLARDFTDMEKIDFDVSRIRKNMSEKTERQMLKYLKKDCVTLYQTLHTFTGIIKDLSDGVCKPQLTIGSTTMNMYRSKFMPNIEISQFPDKEQNFRDAYYGGRTEVFRIDGNNEDLAYYDINSLYPYVYSQKPIPIGNIQHVGGNRDVIDMDNYGGVAKIEAKVKDVYAPVLPYRYKPSDSQASKVVFPKGNVSGWYNLNELRYALQMGQIDEFEIKDAYISKYGEPFKEYGEHLYGLKQEIDKNENPAKYAIVKLLLNSFYGKFGMSREQSEVVRLNNLDDLGQLDDLKPINPKLEEMGLYEKETESDANYIIPRIASTITSYARIEMHKLMRKADRRIWYCDTDSIVTDKQLSESDELGGLDKELDIQEAYFLAPKVYAIRTTDGDDILKGKGMKDLYDNNTFEDYRNSLDNPQIGTSWESPKGILPSFKEYGEFKKESYSRGLRQLDNKRQHYENHQNSEPLKI